jgi:nicotinamide-nucleotide amidase
VLVLPGPPRELQAMWPHAVATEPARQILDRSPPYLGATMRLFGIPESEIAETLREADRQGVPLERLEITTCLKRGEIEVVTRYEPDAEQAYEQLVGLIRERHADTLFSEDGGSIDDQVSALLRRDLGAETAAATRSIATAESCTGGMLAARLTDPPGASDYFRGAVVAYANDVKVSEAGVPEELIARHGAVSREVAEALADGARTRLDADVGVGVTGVAGPGGGTPDKPVGLVWFSVAAGGDGHLTRSVNLPGGRADIRDRATTVAMHLIARALRGERDAAD